MIRISSSLRCILRLLTASVFALAACAAGQAQVPSPVQNISSTASGSSSYPGMVVDAQGNINITWVDGVSGVNFARSTNSGASFLPAVAIAGSTGATFQPQMVVDSTGSIIEIAWAKPSAAGNGAFDVFVSRSTDGGLTFGSQTYPPAIQVSTSPAVLVDSPRIAFNGAGVVVVWVSSPGTCFTQRP